jgi:hypothetical protein
MAGGGVGVPDGSSFKTIVIEHRSLLSITPNSDGKIGFAVVANPFGAVAVNRGKFEATCYKVQAHYNPGTGEYGPDTLTGLFPTYMAGPGTIAFDPSTLFDNFAADYSIVPFNEWLTPITAPTGSTYAVSEPGAALEGLPNQRGLRIARWRTITATGRIRYIGDALHNSGVMAIARSGIEVASKFDIKCLLTSGAGPTAWMQDAILGQAASSCPTSFTSVATMPGAKVLPVKCGADVICPPSDFAWHEWEDAFFLGKNTCIPRTSTVVDDTSNPQPYSAEDMSTSLWNPAFAGMAYGKYSSPAVDVLRSTPIPGWSNNDVTFVQVQGMQQEQPIIIETRTCCEYTLAFDSPSARFARDSPRSRPAALKTVMDVARTVPAAKPPNDGISWLNSAITAIGDVMSGPVGKLSKRLAGMALGALAPPLAPLAIGWGD